MRDTLFLLISLLFQIRISKIFAAPVRICLIITQSSSPYGINICGLFILPLHQEIGLSQVTIGTRLTLFIILKQL